MIYLDTSVALAHLLAEDRQPPDSIWSESIVSSRLLQYETWVRVHAKGLSESHGDVVRELLARVAFIELSPLVLARAQEPFPTKVRTLDALHLASIEFLRGQGLQVELAAYDERLLDGARALGIDITAL